LSGSLVPGGSLAVLGIELPTRRRNRANGQVIAVDASGFRLRVEESFGNCPKYIQRRTPRIVAAEPSPGTWRFESDGMDEWARGLIARADTLFVASYADPQHGSAKRRVDVSHRGGRSGFVHVAADGTLTLPDFVGNFYFNTLGNLLANPRAGIVIPDFTTGDLLFLSGRTEIVWDGPEVARFPGASLALLGIELPTRRRNRANGHVVALDEAGFRLRVEESFGNCPKYIQRRTPRIVAGEAAREAWRFQPGGLNEWARGLVGCADTLFVASYADREHGAPKRRVDVSHRGGNPGFVHVAEDGTLTVPDLVGNFLFNTLGNLLANPRAGVVVPDFGTGDVLFLSGATEIVWDGPEVARFAGAQRLWRLRPSAGIGLRGALPLRGELEERSPELTGTGRWPTCGPR
jgi:predicted pyridoxine 5'-phosphate oxidase superfamily flavin-nucleotide-binding protein